MTIVIVAHVSRLMSTGPVRSLIEEVMPSPEARVLTEALAKPGQLGGKPSASKSRNASKKPALGIVVRLALELSLLPHGPASMVAWLRTPMISFCSKTTSSHGQLANLAGLVPLIA